MDLNKPIPRVRRDLELSVYEENSHKFIVFRDPEGLAAPNIAIPYELFPFLEMLDGELTPSSFSDWIKKESGNEVDLKPFMNVVEFLDNNLLLESPVFYREKLLFDEYKNSPVRPPICAGNSYPNEPETFDKVMGIILNMISPDGIEPGAEAIIVPHIDFRVGANACETYSAGYRAIRDSDAELFVIFGTSHHVNSDYFMLTDKDYSTPKGVVVTDKEIMSELSEAMPFTITIDNTAHRFEHSIEFQIALLQKAFENRNFKVLPILVGSFHEFVGNNTLPKQDEIFRQFTSTLKKVVENSGKKTVFIASVDFAHIGRKFGDEFDAEPELERLKNDDLKLIEALSRCDADSFFKHVSQVHDKNKICGLSPIYSMLQTVSPEKAHALYYGQWNEAETRSAVSFASLAYYK